MKTITIKLKNQKRFTLKKSKVKKTVRVEVKSQLLIDEPVYNRPLKQISHVNSTLTNLFKSFA